MQLDIPLWLIAVVIGVIGGAGLIYLMRRKPDWKKPLYWAAVGIIFYQLLMHLVEFIVKSDH